jgi:hypothetical protein
VLPHEADDVGGVELAVPVLDIGVLGISDTVPWLSRPGRKRLCDVSNATWQDAADSVPPSMPTEPVITLAVAAGATRSPAPTRPMRRATSSQDLTLALDRPELTVLST